MHFLDKKTIQYVLYFFSLEIGPTFWSKYVKLIAVDIQSDLFSWAGNTDKIQKVKGNPGYSKYTKQPHKDQLIFTNL